MDHALRGVRRLVGGSPARGVVAAASYEARAGRRSAMPMRTAAPRVSYPQAVIVAATERQRFPRYRQASEQVMAIFRIKVTCAGPGRRRLRLTSSSSRSRRDAS